MNVQKQIKEYITSQPEPKRGEMQELHQHILQVLPKCYSPRKVNTPKPDF